jgi:hypothetical protein
MVGISILDSDTKMDVAKTLEATHGLFAPVM